MKTFSLELLSVVEVDVVELEHVVAREAPDGGHVRRPRERAARCPATDSARRLLGAAAGA